MIRAPALAHHRQRQGLSDVKNPCNDTSITRCHCSTRIPANTASSWTPALLTRMWIGPFTSSDSSASRVCTRSARSNETASAEPPAAAISSTTRCADSGWVLQCTSTWCPSPARRRQIRAADSAAAAGDDCAPHVEQPAVVDAPRESPRGDLVEFGRALRSHGVKYSRPACTLSPPLARAAGEGGGEGYFAVSGTSAP